MRQIADQIVVETARPFQAPAAPLADEPAFDPAGEIVSDDMEETVLALAPAGFGDPLAASAAPVLTFQPLYENDFQPGGASNWVYYNPAGTQQIAVPLQTDPGGNSYLSSTGPWWLDPNHTTPGAGYLNLLAIGYAQSVNQEMSLTSLVGTQVSFDIRTENLSLPAGAHIRFWFQAVDTKIPGSAQIVNYALDVPIDQFVVAGEWTRVTLTLSEDDADWIPLFSNPGRTDTYNRSATIRDALEGQLLDSGFIILIGNEAPNPPATGTVMLDNIVYERTDVPEVRYEADGSLQPLDLDAAWSDADSDTVGLSLDLQVTGAADQAGTVGFELPAGSSLSVAAGGIWDGGVRIADLVLSPDGRGLTVTFTAVVAAGTVDQVLAAFGYASGADGYGRDSLNLTVSDGDGGSTVSIVNVWRPYVAPPNQDFLIEGTSGRDWLHGADGDDTLNGYDADDVLNGHAGADTMAGGPGNDWYHIDNIGDRVVEAAGQGAEDRIFSSVSYRLTAGAAVEILGTSFNPGTEAIDLAGNEFANTVFGNAGANQLEGAGGDDTLLGLEGDDRLYGGTGNDALIGAAGHDILDGGAGIDTTDGGLGDDWHFVDHAGDVVIEAAGGGTTDRVFAGVSWILGAAAEIEMLSTTNHAGTAAINLYGNGFANRIFGNEGVNTLDGGGGDDSLVGNGGDDFLYGGAGIDTLNGGAGFDQMDGGIGADVMDGGLGDDWYLIDNAGDRIIERAGEGAADRLFSSVSYVLAAGVEVEILSTDFHTNTTPINLTGNAYGNLIFGNDGANTLDGRDGADVLAGQGGDDRLYGGAGNDELIGGLGADVLDGGAGVDITTGGAGDDWHFIDNALDAVVEAAGEGAADRVFASVSWRLTAGAEIEILSTANHAGTSAIDLYGNAFANIIFGNEGANRLEGGDGADTLSGGGGNDVLDGGLGVDWLVGGLGDDWFYVDHAADTITEAPGQGADRVLASTDYVLGAGVAVELMTTVSNGATAAINLTGNELANTVYGNEGANTLSGMAGNDILLGGGGSDRLIGGQGHDALYGGAGNDVYVLGVGGGADTLTETSGADTIEIAGALTPSDLIYQVVGNDLYVGIVAPGSPGLTASQCADRVRIVGGATEGSGAFVESLTVGGQTVLLSSVLPAPQASMAEPKAAAVDGAQVIPAPADDAFVLPGLTGEDFLLKIAGDGAPQVQPGLLEDDAGWVSPKAGGDAAFMSAFLEALADPLIVHDPHGLHLLDEDSGAGHGPGHDPWG